MVCGRRNFQNACRKAPTPLLPLLLPSPPNAAEEEDAGGGSRCAWRRAMDCKRSPAAPPLPLLLLLAAPLQMRCCTGGSWWQAVAGPKGPRAASPALAPAAQPRWPASSVDGLPMQCLALLNGLQHKP